MKITKLLVLGAMLLVSGSVTHAEIKDGVRVKPTVTVFKDLQIGDTVYLYNVKAQMFFCGANDYLTRASIASTGFKVTFTETAEGVELRDSVLKFNEWRATFSTSDAAAIWVDNNTEANRFWRFEKAGDAYRIVNTTVGPVGTYLGWNGKADDTRLYFVDPTENAEAGVDWKAVAVNVYASLHIEEYLAAEPLKKLLDEAKALGGIDISAYEKVYLDETSTVEAINEAIKTLTEAIEKRKLELALENYDKATGTSPIVVTDLHIKNPSYADNKNTDWQGDEPGFQTFTNAEFYQKVFNVHQDLTDLHEGVYALGVQAFYRPGFAEGGYNLYVNQDAQIKDVKLYVTNDNGTDEKSVVTPYVGAGAKVGTGSESEVTTESGTKIYIPNNMEAAEAYFVKADRYHNNCFFETKGGSATIGMKNSTSIDGNWVIYDNWSLTYYGKGSDAYQAWLDTELNAYEDIVYADTVIYTKSYMTAYQEAKAAAPKATTKAEVIAKLAEFDVIYNNLYVNPRLWKQWLATVDEARKVAGDSSLPDTNYKEDLGGYVDFDAEDILNERKLTNEELQAEIDKLKEWMTNAKADIKPGTDVTNIYLKNADCEKAEGWEGQPVIGTGGGNSCFEKYGQKSFDVYQKVGKAPKGVYSIEVQGFFRHMRPEHNPSSYTLYLRGEQKPYAYVYLNSNLTALKCVYDEPNENQYSQGNDPQDDKYYPNDMTSAAEAFGAGMYKSKAFGLVLNDGDELRIGVKGEEGDADWAIWDNFKLVYEGFSSEVVNPVLKEFIANAKELQSKPMGCDVLSVLQSDMTDAEEASQGTDGEAQFLALTKLSASIAKAKTSIEKFAALVTANDAMIAYAISAPCSNATIEEAIALNERITAGIDGGTLKDQDADDLMKEIDKMMKKLRLPDGMENATDDNAVDCTSLIDNADYAEAKNDGWTITEGVTPGFGNGLIEVFNKDFDEYQDLEGLLEGTYSVTAQGFYRFGSAKNDYDTYAANPDENNNMLLYVKVGDDEMNVAMPRLSSEGTEEHISVKVEEKDGEPVLNKDGKKTFIAGDDLSKDQWHWAWIGDPVASADSTSATGIRIINGLSTAAIAFEAGKFQGTTVTFKVGADGKARIGMKKTIQEDQNWCAWDNWRLTYYGKNSSKDVTPTGISTTAAEAMVMRTEYFNLNGVRINGAIKGIAIRRQTLSDGTVNIQKVIIR